MSQVGYGFQLRWQDISEFIVERVRSVPDGGCGSGCFGFEERDGIHSGDDVHIIVSAGFSFLQV